MAKAHETNKTNQETAPAGTSPTIHACNARISTKTGAHHAEAAAHNATLLPFVVGSRGAFYPLETSPGPVHGGHNPAATLKTVFGTNGPPHLRAGKMALAVEEGMIRNVANRVASDGIGL